MTDMEIRVGRIESKLEAFMRSQDDKINNFIQEMRQQNQMRANEIRDLQKRQDEERRKLDTELQAAQRRHEDDMNEMNRRIDTKFDKLSDQIHTMTIAAVVGFGAIAVAIGGLVVSALK